MAISIRSRIRNALVGLTLFVCACFVGLVFLIAFVIEDEVFIKQLKAEQTALIEFLERGEPLSAWSGRQSAFSIIGSPQAFPADLTPSNTQKVVSMVGVHEYFNQEQAGFISHFKHPVNNSSVYLVYDVSPFLAVRGSKQSILIFLMGLSVTVLVATIWISNHLASATLRPVNKLVHSLDNNDVISELTQKFDDDEIGVLAKSLAQAMQRVQKAAQREQEFNQGVSHELRSPIQVAQSSVELMLYKHSQQAPPELLRLDRAVKQMNEITEAFLWLVSERQHEIRGCAVATLTKLCDEIQTNQAISKELSVTPQHAYPLPESALKVIVRGTLNNAIVHGDGAPITVEFRENTIVVTNSYSDHFQQEEYAGFGLGQTITKRLCEHFGCSLEFINNEQGKEFTATLQFESL